MGSIFLIGTIFDLTSLIFFPKMRRPIWNYGQTVADRTIFCINGRCEVTERARVERESAPSGVVRRAELATVKVEFTISVLK